MNNVLLVGDKSMPEMHLKQSGFTYSAFVEKFMQTAKTDFIYRNEFDKACFQIKRFSKKNSIRQSFER